MADKSIQMSERTALGTWDNLFPVTKAKDVVTTSTQKFVSDAQITAWNAKANASDVYTKGETDTRISNVIGSAPSALDTLKELADALGNDANFSATITATLGNKVDKVAGKDLSTNDYTSAEKTKLAGIATGANNYVHPSTHPATIITQTSTARFVSDTQIATWNGKADAVHTHNYNDLTNKPTIPTNTNQLTNGAGFLTASDVVNGTLIKVSTTEPTLGEGDLWYKVVG